MAISPTPSLLPGYYLGLITQGNQPKRLNMHKTIPTDWKIQRSTPFFTRDNIPQALLHHHNTAEGVFGQLCVMAGTVTYYGYPDKDTTKATLTINIKAGEFTTIPPQQWHRVELSDDAQFNINFWSNKDCKSKPLINTQ